MEKSNKIKKEKDIDNCVNVNSESGDVFEIRDLHNEERSVRKEMSQPKEKQFKCEEPERSVRKEMSQPTVKPFKCNEGDDSRSNTENLTTHRHQYIFDASTKCSKCNHIVSEDNWVHQVGEFIYHLSCFSCDSCQGMMNAGEKCGVVENNIFCKVHYEDEEAINRVKNRKTAPQSQKKKSS